MKQKKFFTQSAMLVVLGTSIFFSSCEKDDTPAPTNTITDIVVSGSTFTTLNQQFLKQTYKPH